jgi:heptaprenyl diphosphate synthase
MTSIHNEELQSVLDEIGRLVSHPYVNRVIGNPVIPVFFVHVLFRMLQALGVSGKRLRLYSVAAALLKMGLDTHDRVSTEIRLPAEERRQRQLLVLAGDYYSSLFYRLLSAHGEVEGIRRLSEAICAINERKTTNHLDQEEEPLTESRLKRMGWIESGILTALADFFHVEKNSDNPWRGIGFELMFLDALSRMVDQAEGQLEKLARFAKEAQNRLERLLEPVGHPEIREELHRLALERVSMVHERIWAKGSEVK